MSSRIHALLACAAALLLAGSCSLDDQRPAAYRGDASIGQLDHSCRAPDAGPVAIPAEFGGCLALDAYEDCDCRCPAGLVGSIGGSNPTFLCRGVCACGLSRTDAREGCREDSDCLLARADCCGCAKGGMSVAILASREAEWDAQLDAVCGDSGCGTESQCGFARAYCHQSRCTTYPCAANEFFYVDDFCNQMPEGNECASKGDGKCYRRCSGDGDCPAGFSCQELKLYAGTHYEGYRKENVCRVRTGNELPPDAGAQ